MYLGQNHSTDSGEGRNKRYVQEFLLWPWHLKQKHFMLFIYRQSFGEVWANWAQKSKNIVKIYCTDLLWPWTLTLKCGSRSKAHLLTKGNLLITYEHDWPKGKESIIKNWISKRPTLTFTVDLEKWFKITTHPLPTLTLHVNYKPDRANGENAWSRQVI